MYDGSGQRMEQSVNTSGTTTATAYLLGGVEEVTGGVITTYLGVAGLPSAVRVGSTLSYLVSDGLNSVSEAFDTAGNETAAQLYTPYGQTRYSSGVMPTAKGFTSQRADATTGLDYYGARYYDARAGQFTSADSIPNGLSPYAYVTCNPETDTDPTGHLIIQGSGDGSNSSPQPNWPNYGPYIAAHRNDLITLPPFVYDDRGFDGNILKVFGFHRTREENQETADANVLCQYFGLGVWIQDRSDGNNPNTPPKADYLVGLWQEYPSLSYPGAEVDLVAATPMDLLYPQAGTSMRSIDKSARDKAKEQAPVIVIDMSQNQWWKAATPEQQNAFLNSLVNPNRGTTVPKRVIIIDNGGVVNDVQYKNNNFGPDPEFEPTSSTQA